MLVVDINLYDANQYTGNGKQKPLALGHVVIYNDGTSRIPGYGHYKVHAFEDSGKYIAYLEIRNWWRVLGMWRFIIRVFQGLGSVWSTDFDKDRGFAIDRPFR
jgi:hypothetical protein